MGLWPGEFAIISVVLSAPPIPAAPARAKLPTLHEFFSAGGILSKSSLNFEVRKGQYDMAKAVDRGMRIEGVRLLEKRGGKSGVWRAEEAK